MGAQASKGLSHNGPYNQNPVETSIALFERIFGAGFRAPGDEAIIDPSIGLRRSVLDAVVGDTNRLQQRLGYADRIRMEQYLDGIRAIEFQLAKLEEDPPNLAACIKPNESSSSELLILLMDASIVGKTSRNRRSRDYGIGVRPDPSLF